MREFGTLTRRKGLVGAFSTYYTTSNFAKVGLQLYYLTRFVCTGSPSSGTCGGTSSGTSLAAATEWSRSTSGATETRTNLSASASITSRSGTAALVTSHVVCLHASIMSRRRSGPLMEHIFNFKSQHCQYCTANSSVQNIGRRSSSPEH